MASALHNVVVVHSPKHFVVALSLLSLLAPCFCIRGRRLDDSDPSTVTRWTSATASWYGNPYGYGTDGGACGYKGTVGSAPFNSMIAAGGPSIYKGGAGCGACYQIRCTSHPLCSGKGIRVVIADECPGCYDDAAFFDMSGTAFGALGRSFTADEFRNLGRVKVEYRRVPCKYKDNDVTFTVDSGSNPYYLAVLVEYIAGDGDMTLLEVMTDSSSGNWYPMERSWGAVWKHQGDSSMPGPFSFRITTGSGKQCLVENGVPDGWQPGQTYTSTVQCQS